MRRRRVLETAGGLGLVGLSGCLSLTGGGGESTDDEEDETGETEETMDTETTEPTESDMPTGQSELTYGFESPSLANWTVADADWGRSEQYTWSGEASAGIETSAGAAELATASPGELDGGAEISSLTYYWRETADSFGGGVALKNSNGNVELFAGTDNPQWIVVPDPDSGEYTELYGGDGMDRWIRVDLDFDWDAGTVTVAFTDTTTGTSRSETFDLRPGANVEAISLLAFTSAEFEAGDGFEAQNCYMYWDAIQVTL